MAVDWVEVYAAPLMVGISLGIAVYVLRAVGNGIRAFFTTLIARIETITERNRAEHDAFVAQLDAARQRDAALARVLLARLDVDDEGDRVLMESIVADSIESPPEAKG